VCGTGGVKGGEWPVRNHSAPALARLFFNGENLKDMARPATFGNGSGTRAARNGHYAGNRGGVHRGLVGRLMGASGGRAHRCGDPGQKNHRVSWQRMLREGQKVLALFSYVGATAVIQNSAAAKPRTVASSAGKRIFIAAAWMIAVQGKK